MMKGRWSSRTPLAPQWLTGAFPLSGLFPESVVCVSTSRLGGRQDKPAREHFDFCQLLEALGRGLNREELAS